MCATTSHFRCYAGQKLRKNEGLFKRKKKRKPAKYETSEILPGGRPQQFRPYVHMNVKLVFDSQKEQREER